MRKKYGKKCGPKFIEKKSGKPNIEKYGKRT
jgi:hypothetical protein